MSLLLPQILNAAIVSRPLPQVLNAEIHGFPTGLIHRVDTRLAALPMNSNLFGKPKAADFIPLYTYLCPCKCEAPPRAPAKSHVADLKSWGSPSAESQSRYHWRHANGCEQDIIAIVIAVASSSWWNIA